MLVSSLEGRLPKGVGVFFKDRGLICKPIWISEGNLTNSAIGAWITPPLKHPITWRIIPVSKWLITMDSKSSK